VPRRKSSPTTAQSNLAKARIKERISQKQMAEWVGVSLRHYRRIELHIEDDDDDLEKARPTLAFLVNCSLVLSVPFDEVAPPGWSETWTDLNDERPIRPFPFEVEEARQDWGEP
jgi:transcriptional regulator with XRE-family HTH domain